MNPLVLMFALFLALTMPGFAQMGGLPEKDPRDPTCRWDRPTSTSLFRDCAANDKACERDTNSHNREVAKSPAHSKNELSWLDQLKADVKCIMEHTKDPNTQRLIVTAATSPDRWRSVYEEQQRQETERAKAGIKETALKPCFKDRAAAMGLNDMTDLGVTNDRQATQNLVDAVKVIDPRAEVFCNDRNIVGAMPHAEEHNDHVQVKWSGEPCSPTGAKFLETGDAAALEAAVAAMQKERQAQREAEEHARCMRVLTALSTLDNDLSENGWITRESKKMEQNRSKQEQNNK